MATSGEHLSTPPYSSNASILHPLIPRTRDDSTISGEQVGDYGAQVPRRCEEGGCACDGRGRRSEEESTTTLIRCDPVPRIGSLNRAGPDRQAQHTRHALGGVAKRRPVLGSTRPEAQASSAARCPWGRTSTRASSPPTHRGSAQPEVPVSERSLPRAIAFSDRSAATDTAGQRQVTDTSGVEGRHSEVHAANGREPDV